MKRKHAAAQAAPHAVVLSPRQVALRQLYRFLALGGSVALAMGLFVAGIIYQDRIHEFLFPSARSRANALRAGEDDGSPLKLNSATPPGIAPEGMAWIPGGEFYMGTEDETFPDAGPVHRVYVDGFWMDRTEVTNAQYAEFVKATHYVTVAEQQPDPRDFPSDIPPEDLKPFSSVFKKPAPGSQIDLNDFRAWWDVSYGASWKHPEGPSSDLKDREKHPAVHISYEDAVAYCKWANKRLPTEAEWEFAARGGLDRKKFPWGDELKPEGKWMANTWQGQFPLENTREDGYLTTAPVATYPPNGYGLHDVGGNVWEWCSDFYQAAYYTNSPRKNPAGPAFGYDINEPKSEKRVQRGGSFLCAENYCQRYIVGSRHHGEPKSASNHVGFRCVKNAR